MVAALGLIGAYVLLTGFISLAEKLLARDLDAFQLGAALRTGALVLALAAVLGAGDLRSLTLLSTLAGLGIGLIAGVGSIFYCRALEKLPVWMVNCVANAYILVTVLLGILVLGEAVTVQKVAGVGLTVAGIMLLSYHGNKTETDTGGRGMALRGIVSLLPYILAVGVSAFLEKPALRHLDPLQLNAAVAVGTVVVALAALLLHDRQVQLGRSTLEGFGLGMLLGLASIVYYLGLRHLAVSLAATLGNTSILVTVALSIVVLHDRFTLPKAAGMATILVGVVVLTLRLP